MKKFIIISFGIIVFVVLFFVLAFPKKYTNQIMFFAEKYSLSPAMIASVINIESSYSTTAESDAGAKGLMQLLPSTAEECAKKLDMEGVTIDLFDTETNIEIGCFYLSYLLNVFDNNITNVLCAYNWGMGNVNDWINEGNVDNNGTITNIPVKETRNYIKKYRCNLFVYEKIYKLGSN